MTPLHNSRGEHIANFVNGHLHATSGENIGHYLAAQKIFIDMSGHYLGEIVNGNRLLCRQSSPHRNAMWGVGGNVGNVGNFGNFGNIGNAGMPGGYEDIPEGKLGR